MGTQIFDPFSYPEGQRYWPRDAAAAIATAYATNVQTLATATSVPLTFDLATISNYNIWVAASPTRFTAPADGLYLAIGQLCLDVGAANKFFNLTIWLNGNATTPRIDSSGTMGNIGQCDRIQTSAVLPLTAGDYVTFVGLQITGGNLNTITNPGCWGTLVRLSTHY